MQGVRFLHEVINEYTAKARLDPKVLVKAAPKNAINFVSGQNLSYHIDGHGAKEKPIDTTIAYDTIVKILEDPNTKRILFDSRQAAIFDDLGFTSPPIQAKLHLPFPKFYMEFTEPIALDNQEPNWADVTRAMIVEDIGYEYTFGTIKGNLIQVTLLATGYPRDQMDNPEAMREHRTYVDRTWKIDLQKGTSFVTLGSLRAAAAGAGEPLTNLPDDLPAELFWPIGMRVKPGGPEYASVVERELETGEALGRPYLPEVEELSWYERALLNDTSLLSWCIAYMMAKSVVIQEEPIPRPERRRIQREGKIPQPWHIVTVDPKVISSHGGPTPYETGIHHSYRYDVIGHLRFGRHPRKDGTYSETIEWIASHQRGLANTVYIPKTYLVEKKGQMISDPVKGYFGRTS